MRRLEANLQRGVMLAKRLDRGVQMIAHDRAVQPAAQPRLVTRLGLSARLRARPCRSPDASPESNLWSDAGLAKWVTK